MSNNDEMDDDFAGNFERQKAQYYERMNQNFQIYELGESLNSLVIQENNEKNQNVINNDVNMQM